MEWMIFFTLIMILLDILTGIIKGIKLKKFNSKKLRQGGLNKLTEVLVMVFGYVLQYALPYFKVKVDFNILILICTYLFFMECVSIVENVGKINPDLIPEKLKNTLEKLKGEWQSYDYSWGNC